MYKRVSDFSNLRYPVPSICVLFRKISNIPIPFSPLRKTTSTKMKISQVTLMSLLVASTPISQALSVPRWRSHSDTRLAKRTQRVTYAGINIAGCEFGIDTNVIRLHSTLDVR